MILSMYMKNKHLILSFVYFIVAVILMVVDINISGGELVDKFDWFVFRLSNYTLSNSTISIEYYLSLLLPIIFAGLSIYSGIRFIKQKPTQKLRMVGIVILTVSIASTVLIILSNLFI